MKIDSVKIKEILRGILEEESLVKIIFSVPFDKKSSEVITKIVGKPLLIKGKVNYQVEYFKMNKAHHINYEKDEFFKYITESIEQFKNLNIIAKDCEYNGINNGEKFHLKKIIKTNENFQIKEQNKEKNYLLPQGEPIEFLIDLGVMDREGNIIKSSYNKYKQINKYLEFIEVLIEELKSKKLIGKTLKIVDFGSGKSYLTFAMYYYLKEKKGLNLEIIGLDLKKDVMEECQKLGEKYKFENLHFICGDIKEFTQFKEVDIVFSLHACDTATDYAILKGLELGAKAILAVPCCQKEFNGQITKNSGEVKNALNLLTDFGILKEKFTSLLTDGFRGKVLELCGYKVNVLEFISTEHTPKNILIRGVLDTNYKEKVLNEKKEKLEQIMEFLKIKPILWELTLKYFKCN